MKPHEAPLRVYGSEISYFTGKLEAYLRFKEIPYRRVPLTLVTWNRTLPRKTGAMQMPAVELPDGRWMTDTTPIIEWLESELPETTVIPTDPLQGWVSRLVEDYADEWMWRPALHYRWSFRPDAQLLSRKIVDEMLGQLPLPGFLKRRYIRQRQMRRYVRGDGVSEATRAHVEGIYRKTLERLEAIFRNRPFLLGEVPTLADFGFFASMFRHFSLDPTPRAIMLEHAPAVYAWVARLWAARASQTRGPLLAGVPPDWGPILGDIGQTYLPYLAANGAAWKTKRRRFNAEVQGVQYRGLPTSRYRVWCLERLRRHFCDLPEEPAQEARALLETHGCWQPLWDVETPASGYDPDNQAPFGHGLAVFGA